VIGSRLSSYGYSDQRTDQPECSPIVPMTACARFVVGPYEDLIADLDRGLAVGAPTKTINERRPGLVLIR